MEDETQPDAEIDYSDIPEMTDFSSWERGPYREFLRRRREARKLVDNHQPVDESG